MNRVNSRNGATPWWQHNKYRRGIILRVSQICLLVIIYPPLWRYIDGMDVWDLRAPVKEVLLATCVDMQSALAHLLQSINSKSNTPCWCLLVIFDVSSRSFSVKQNSGYCVRYTNCTVTWPWASMKIEMECCWRTYWRKTKEVDGRNNENNHSPRSAHFSHSSTFTVLFNQSTNSESTKISINQSINQSMDQNVNVA